MQFLNITGYQFIALDNLPELRIFLLKKCEKLELKGTILLSPEGINLALSGKITHIAAFKTYCATNLYFKDINFKESYSVTPPFKRLKVKLKKEIITFRRPEINPVQQRAPLLSPRHLKQWLDEGRTLTLLDTRNDYEIKYGTFLGATQLYIQDFCEFPNALENLPIDKPVVMFCTGGVRCEKAGLYLINKGFAEVYQLDGGILNYFTMIGNAHYQGTCFVFDERVALKPNLEPITL
ncbi:MAG: moeZ 1 [Gammaproteobacteria bacterium]|jgi:UPF0176 protein|nr:moeZ 1 [Gammaproteobacteria bacterium]